MFPRSRIVVLGAVASVLLVAAGCKTDKVTGVGPSDTSISTKRSAAPAKGAGFSGAIDFAGKIGAKAKVSIVDEHLTVIAFASGGTADASGKFAVRPAPDRVYFVVAELDGAKVMGVVLPVVATKNAPEPVVHLDAASTLAVGGVIGLFGTNRYDLRDLPMDKFEALVKAIAATNPTVDLKKTPTDHAAQFKTLYESNAAVKTAYDAIFALVKTRLQERSPGATEPSPTAGVITPSLTPSGSGFASNSPTPAPTATPTLGPGETPVPTLAPGETPSPTPQATATPPITIAISAMSLVTGTADGQAIKGESFNALNYFNMTKLDLPAPFGPVLVIPDNDRLWAVKGAGTFSLIDLSGKLGATVSGVYGLAVDGLSLHMVAKVDGVLKLMTVEAPGFSPTTKSVSGDLPSVMAGHALYQGQLYVADRVLHRIHKIDVATGVSTIFLGNGTQEGIGDPVAASGTVPVYQPCGLGVVDDKLYIVESGHSRILRTNLTTGIVDVLSGVRGEPALVNGSLSQARFFKPSTLQIDGNFLIIGDSRNNAFRRIDLEKGWVASYSSTANAPNGANTLTEHLGGGVLDSLLIGVDIAGKFNKATLTP